MLILVSGGSACGKGSLTKKLKEFAFDKEMEFIDTDDYMRFGANHHRVANETVEEQVQKEINCCDPQYLFLESLKMDIKGGLEKNKIVIVGGIHSLIDKEIRNLADLKVFIEADWDLRLIRKIKRSPWYKKSIGEEPEDTRRFGGCLPIALKRWAEGQKIGENKWILPTKKHADFVMSSNSLEEFNEGVNKIAEFINTGKKDFFESEPKSVIFWRQPGFYYGGLTGASIATLGIGSYWLFKINFRK